MKNKKKKSDFQKFIRQLHLYLGLTSGLVVFIVAITGCLWVFQEEILELTDDLPKIEQQNGRSLVSPLEAGQIAMATLPGKHVHGTMYSGKDAAVEVIFYEADPEFYHSVFIHPYNGEVLSVKDQLQGFFPFVLEGHMHLWLPEEIGSEIVAWSTVVFAIMLITGIILWWPRNKKARKQRFWFRWKESTKWKRKNYDMHSIAGFYVGILALILATTGLVMTFEPFEEAVHKVAGGEKEVHFSIPENISAPQITDEETAPIDRLLPKLMAEYPQAKDFEIHYPFTDSSSIYVEISYQDGVYYNADYRFYDQYTLEEISTPGIYGAYSEAGFSDKVLRMNYDIHVGAIAGLPGKILAFFISLICASLPLTGFMIWYGKKFKKTAKKPIANFRMSTVEVE